MIGFVKIIFRRATVEQDDPVNGPVSSLKSSLQDERRKTKDERRNGFSYFVYRISFKIGIVDRLLINLFTFF